MLRITALLFLCISVHAQQVITIPPSTVLRFDIPVAISVSKPSRHTYGLYNKLTGKTYPLQWEGTKAIFILGDTIQPGSSLTLTLKKIPKTEATVKLQKTDKQVTATVRNHPLLVYNISEVAPPADSPAYYKRSGFIHPLYTPSGQVITDDFPSNHAHQHAVFHAWTNTTFRGKHVDFWNQHQKQGTVGNASVISIKEGPVYSELVTRQEYIGFGFGTILTELWTIRIYNTSRDFLFDISVHQENITADTLQLEKYIYGGMAFRGSKQWDRFNKKEFRQNWSVLTSEGLKDSAANHTAAKWVMVSGLINGIASTATVFNHPSNFRYPQKIRVHPEMPYWVYTPVVDEGFNLPPKGEYNAKYRYLVSDQPPTKERISDVSDSW